MTKVKLALFALNQFSAMAIDRAGAEWIGGDHRRRRAKAHGQLVHAAMEGLLHNRIPPEPPG
ncbi:hypothetical protein LSUCC0031_06305 [Rhodobacterales bacterium LSUCC0031]|nr:hypothetical protein [Rhodobacterales bacterium LSUCC0031]